MSAELKMKVSAETNQAQRELEKINDSLGKMNSMNLTKLSASFLIVKQAISEVNGAAKEMIEIYKTQEQSEVRLASVLKATGNQINMSARELLDLAGAVQEVTKFGDEAVLEAEKLLIATQALDEDGLKRALMTTADLAEAMKTDISSAASTMAYALQDPTQGLTRLRRQGMAFTEEEIEQVKALQDANDLYGAQALVLDKIESKYKGVASAVASTDTGTLDQIKNVWGDIKEDLGEGIVGSLAPAFTYILDMLKKIHEWASDHIDQGNFWEDVQTGDSHTLYSNYAEDFLKERRSEAVSDVSAQLELIRSNPWGQFIEEAIDTNLEDLLWMDNDTLKGVLETYLPSGYENFFGDLDEGFFEMLKEPYDKLVNTVELIDAALGEYKNAYTVEKPSGTVVTGSGSGSPTSILDSESAFESFMKSNGGSSISYQAAVYDEIIAKAKEYKDLINEHGGDTNEDGSFAILELLGLPEGTSITDVRAMGDQLDEIIAATQEKKDNLFKSGSDKGSDKWLPTDYLSDYQEQVDHLNAEISLLADQIEETKDPATVQYLQEVQQGLLDDLDALTKVKDGADDTGLSLKDMFKDVASAAYDAYLSISESLASIWENQASQISKEMEQMRDAGTLTVAQEEEMQRKINDLEKKAFEARKANALAEATVSYGQAVMKAWANDPNPVVAGIVTGLATAAYGAQVAAISSQTYMPSYGQGAYELLQDQVAQVHKGEMIVPKPFADELRGKGMAGSGVVININGNVVGNVEEEIFHAIERAQRTGALPSWRYA